MVKIGNMEFEARAKQGKKGVSYEYSLYYNDENGVNRRKWYTFHPPAGETNEKEIAKLFQADIRTHEDLLKKGVSQKAPKFGDLMQEWLETKARNNHAIATYVSDLRWAKRLSNSVLADITVDMITPRNVGLYFNSLTLDGANHARSGGLSTGSIRLIKTVILSVMDYAVEQGFIVSNPVKHGLTVPQQRHKQAKRKDGFDMFSEAEVEVFKKALKDIPLYKRTFFGILLATGARKSEILSLKYDDLNGNVLKLDNNQVLDENGKAHVNADMKTPRSHRFNRLPQGACNLIHELNAENAEKRKNCEAHGLKWLDDRNGLFLTSTGKALHNDSPNNWLDRIIVTHPDELHHVRVHSFRDLFVSALIASGKYTIPEIAMLIGDTPHTVSTHYAAFFRRKETPTNSPADDLPWWSDDDPDKPDGGNSGGKK